jgi:subtilisin family serine protease
MTGLARWALSLALTAGLAACGGGGGGGGGGGPQLTPRAFETQEYKASWGLGGISASQAYATGATGRGVTVAVIDTGIDTAHPEFQGALAPASVNIVSGVGGAGALADPDGHGTTVAGVIAARRNGSLSHGVAFDARLLVVRADDGTSCASGCVFRQSDVARATDHAIAHGARIINLSLGGGASIGGELSAALARAVDGGAVVVISAGNGGADSPSFPALFALDPRAGGQVIAVGALRDDDQLASFSNRAGEASEVFLAAPGSNILAPLPGGGAAPVSGTSIAAPHVSGAAALVLQSAPFLSAAEVAEILLESAVDLGAPGSDPIFGRGRLDVGRALAPQGALQVPQGERVDGDLAPLAGTGLVLGTAFGRGPALGEVLVLDAYGRPYRVDLAAATGAAGKRAALEGRLAPAAALHGAATDLAPGLELSLVTAEPAPSGDGAPEAVGPLLLALRASGDEVAISRGFGLADRFGLARHEPAVGLLISGQHLASPYLGLANGGEALTLRRQLGGSASLTLGLAAARPGPDGPLAGAERTLAVGEVAGALPGGGELGLHLGGVVERGSLLHSRAGGALALPGHSLTRFAGASARLPLGAGMELLGQASVGLTAPGDAAAGLLSEVSALRSTSFGVGLAQSGLLREGDRAVLGLVQPVRIGKGRAILDRPLERSLEGEVVRVRERVGLEPDGRELDLEAGYSAALGGGRSLAVNWLTRLEPGHDRRRSPDHVLAVRLRAPL